MNESTRKQIEEARQFVEPTPVERERRRIIEVLIDERVLKGREFIKHIQPEHGDCCTCQTCGFMYEDCACKHNGILARIKEVKKPK